MKAMPDLKNIPQGVVKQIDHAWVKYWNEYLEDFPDADGNSYLDEQQAFYREKLNEFLYD